MDSLLTSIIAFVISVGANYFYDWFRNRKSQEHLKSPDDNTPNNDGTSGNPSG